MKSVEAVIQSGISYGGLNNWEEIKMVTPDLTLLLFVPIYVMFIWQFYNPKKAILRGQVFFLLRYYQPKDAFERQGLHNSKEGIDVTEKEIKQVKVSSVVGVILLSIMIIFIILI